MNTQIQTSLDAWAQVDKQYPGIAVFKNKLKNVSSTKLVLLANLIKLNLPKHFYPREIQELDQLIQDFYYDIYSRGSVLDSLDSQQTEEIPRTCRTKSDEDEAHKMLNLRIPSQKFSISQIKQFVKAFDDFRNVSDQLKTKISEFSQIKKQKAVYQSQQWKKKQKNIMPIRKTQSKQSKDFKEKNDIVIVLGDRIPIEVKEMRGFIKTNSLNSFAISSQKMEKQMSQIQLDKTSVRLALNKVAKENLFDIFEEIKPLAIYSKEMSSFIAKEILQKCIEQPKMADVYIKFACLFTKISAMQFTWQWRQQKEHTKTQSFHDVLTQTTQNLFKDTMLLQPSKKIKYVCFAIGSFIKYRKFSRKIFPLVLSKLLESICTDSKEENKQYYFEAIISLIDSTGELYDENWGQQDINQVLPYQLLRKVSKKQVKSIEQLMFQLVQTCNFSISRIKCLLQNLFQNRNIHPQTHSEPSSPSQQSNPQSYSQPLTQPQLKSLITQQNGFHKLNQLLKTNQKLLYSILITILDGKKQQVTQNIKQFMQVCTITKDMFKNCWSNNYMKFADLECDLPFMMAGIADVIRGIGGYEDQYWNIREEQEEEEEDVVYFMEKLYNKIYQ